MTAKALSLRDARIPGLDELRGLSILWVVWCHGTSLWTWMPSVFSGYGFHGVVLFFVISGFLIPLSQLDDLRRQACFFARTSAAFVASVR